MANTIFVRSATKDRHVALAESDDLHPGNHEVFVVGYPDREDGSEDPANIVEVGLTPLVRQKLASGDLIEVERPAVAAAEKETQTANRAAEKQK